MGCGCFERKAPSSALDGSVYRCLKDNAEKRGSTWGSEEDLLHSVQGLLNGEYVVEAFIMLIFSIVVFVSTILIMDTVGIYCVISTSCLVGVRLAFAFLSFTRWPTGIKVSRLNFASNCLSFISLLVLIVFLFLDFDDVDSSALSWGITALVLLGMMHVLWDYMDVEIESNMLHCYWGSAVFGSTGGVTTVSASSTQDYFDIGEFVAQRAITATQSSRLTVYPKEVELKIDSPSSEEDQPLRGDGEDQLQRSIIAQFNHNMWFDKEGNKFVAITYLIVFLVFATGPFFSAIYPDVPSTACGFVSIFLSLVVIFLSWKRFDLFFLSHVQALVYALMMAACALYIHRMVYDSHASSASIAGSIFYFVVSFACIFFLCLRIMTKREGRFEIYDYKVCTNHPWSLSSELQFVPIPILPLN